MKDAWGANGANGVNGGNRGNGGNGGKGEEEKRGTGGGSLPFVCVLLSKAAVCKKYGAVWR